MESFFKSNYPLKMEVRKGENVLVNVNIISWRNSVIMEQKGHHLIILGPSLPWESATKRAAIFI